MLAALGVAENGYELSVVVLSVDDFESYLQTGEDATSSVGTRKTRA